MNLSKLKLSNFVKQLFVLVCVFHSVVETFETEVYACSVYPINKPMSNVGKWILKIIKLESPS